MHLEAQQWLDSMHGSPVGGGGGINEFIPCFPPVGKEPGSEGCNERAEVLNLLRGQKVDLPDLHQLFEGWPAATNVEVDSLRTVVDADLDKLFAPGKRRSKLKASDFGLFSSMWWPHAPFDRLCIATYLGIWLFAWDDEMDSTEYAELTMNWQEAQAFRAATAERARAYLALDRKTPFQGIDGPQTTIRNSIIEEFAPVGHAMVKHYTLDQRQTLMREIDRFIEMCGVEQLAELSDRLPSVESYQHWRMGSSAVGILLAFHEFTLEMRLPQHVMQSPMMQMLWDQTNIVIAFSNDILSVKKEIAQDQVNTLVPLLYVAHGHNLQAAMDDATEMVRNAVAKFELAVKGLLEEFADDPSVTADLVRFIESCRFACTANLNWSLRSGRYGIQDVNLHGGATIQI